MLPMQRGAVVQFSTGKVGWGGDGCEGGKKIEQAKKGNAKGSTLGVSANWTGQDRIPKVPRPGPAVTLRSGVLQTRHSSQDSHISVIDRSDLTVNHTPLLRRRGFLPDTKDIRSQLKISKPKILYGEVKR
jgi:hypothetical protein